MKSFNIIGSGFSGLSSAAFLAHHGNKVNIIEKNNHFGGRARQFKKDGFVFDMGPSWYWMPDIFDNFFNNFNKKTSDYYKLIKLNPSFQIIFDNDHTMKIGSDWNDVIDLFEKYESNSSSNLDLFFNDARDKYDLGLDFLYKSPGISLLELFRKNLILNFNKLELLSSYRKHVYKHFKNKFLRILLEFPVLFLGSSPSSTPALYSLMAYSGIQQGTFYPMGGFGSVISSMVDLCKEMGVNFINNHEINKVSIRNNMIKEIHSDNKSFKSDYFICSADYHHFDQNVLPKKYSNYSNKYWNKREMAPSCLIFYLGIKKKINKLEHHNLFFDEDIEKHMDDIYKNFSWPENPLFYVCCPSKTDQSVSPNNYENIFILVPIPAGLDDNTSNREKYFKKIMNRINSYTNDTILDEDIIVNKSYCVKDFISDYNAFKGNAYGLSNTLLQTANLKPKIINKTLKNLFFTGQLTVPGPGVPPSIISGELVAKYILKKI